MIGLKSMVNIIDNSGGIIAECIQVAKHKSRHGHAQVGDEMVVVVKLAKALASGTGKSNINKVQRGDVRRAVLVRAKKEIARPDGRTIRFSDNAAVLLNQKKELIGTRVNGVVASELRVKGWSRICSLATRVV